MSLELIVLVTNYLLILLAIVLLYKVINKFASSYERKNKQEMDLLQISMTTTIDELNQTLDSIINDSIQEFVVVNNVQEAAYINPELEQEMRSIVMEDTSSRISIVLLNKLRLFYKDDKIPDIIAKKIFLAVSIYTAQNNSLINVTNKKNK